MVDPETNSQEAFQIGSDGKYEAIPTEPSLNFDFEGCQVQLDMKEIWLRQAL
jgi:hypothetical protein